MAGRAKGKITIACRLINLLRIFAHIRLGKAAINRIRPQPPKKEAQVLWVILPTRCALRLPGRWLLIRRWLNLLLTSARCAHVTAAGQHTKWTFQRGQPSHVLQINRNYLVCLQMLEMLGGAQKPVKLDRTHMPVGYVPQHLFQYANGALAPPIGQCIGDAPALGERQIVDLNNFIPNAQQIGQIGHHPIVTGLDKPIVIHGLHILFEPVQFVLENGEECLERVTLLLVAPAIKFR